jgi:hypothetical protein
MGRPAAPAPAGLDAVEAPRVTLAKLPAAATRDLRAVVPVLLAAHARRPDAMHGSTAGPGGAIRVSWRPQRVAVFVYDEQAIATRRAWDAYWRQHAADGLPALGDPVAVAAAPPRPSHGIAAVIDASWSQLRAWHARAPRPRLAAAAPPPAPVPVGGQTNLFDLLAA